MEPCISQYSHYAKDCACRNWITDRGWAQLTDSLSADSRQLWGFLASSMGPTANRPGQGVHCLSLPFSEEFNNTSNLMTIPPYLIITDI